MKIFRQVVIATALAVTPPAALAEQHGATPEKVDHLLTLPCEQLKSIPPNEMEAMGVKAILTRAQRMGDDCYPKNKGIVTKLDATPEEGVIRNFAWMRIMERRAANILPKCPITMTPHFGELTHCQ